MVKRTDTLDNSSGPDITSIYDGFIHNRDQLADLLIMLEELEEDADVLSKEVNRLKDLYSEGATAFSNISTDLQSLRLRIDEFDNDIGNSKKELKKQEKLHESLVSDWEDVKSNQEISSSELNLKEVSSEIESRIEIAKNKIDGFDTYLEKFSDFLGLFHTGPKKLDSEIEKAREERAKLANTREQVEEMIERVQSRERESNAVLQEKIDDFEGVIKDIYKKQNDLEELTDEVDELKETASHLVKGQAGASIGRQFEEREEELRTSVIVWGISSIISIVFLIVSAIFSYMRVINGDLEGMSAFSSVALILPVSVAVWFTASNYNRQKRLMNEYEFKSNMALSLMGFREVLKEDIPEKEQAKVGEFIMETMDKIYSNPQNNVHNSSKDEDDDPLTPGQKSLAKVIERLSN